MVASFPLDSLPENLVLRICSKVASSSVQDLCNLQRASKSYNSLCNDKYVLRHVTFEGLPLHPWFNSVSSPINFSTFTGRCSEAGNPEAELRVGVASYFNRNYDEQQQQRGLTHIASAARQGLELAKFFLGSVLICLGGENKNKGFEILTPFTVPPVPTHGKSLYYHSWMLIFADLRWTAEDMLNRLKSKYVREECKCDGPKYGLLEDPGTYEERFHRFCLLRNEIPSQSCRICFSHRVVQMFFDFMEKE